MKQWDVLGARVQFKESKEDGGRREETLLDMFRLIEVTSHVWLEIASACFTSAVGMKEFGCLPTLWHTKRTLCDNMKSC